MAVGTPVIASNTSAIPEIAGDAAILVDPVDSQALATAMTRIATDTAARERLIEAGKERLNFFSWERSAARLLEVFESVAGTL